MRGNRNGKTSERQHCDTNALTQLNFLCHLLRGKAGNAGIPFSPLSPRRYLAFFLHHGSPCSASR
jgi:hypothetical protein